MHRFQKKVELHTLFEHESLPHAQLGEDADAFLAAELMVPGPVPGAAVGGAGGGPGAGGGVRREK